MKRSLSDFVLLGCLLVIGVTFFVLKEENADRRAMLNAEAAAEKESEPSAPSEQLPIPAETRTQEPPMAPFHLYSLPEPTKGESERILRLEILALRARVAELETLISLREGQIGNWVRLLHPEEVPDQATQLSMSRLLLMYPVVLQPHEGLWVAERIKKNDWKTFADTIDEALFQYLGEARLRQELTPAQFDACKP